MTKQIIYGSFLMVGLFLSHFPILAQLASNQVVTIPFETCTITFDCGEVWNASTDLKEIQKQDTVYLELGLDNNIQGIEFSFAPKNSVAHIELFQSYETSITVMNEGPHLDLIDWKHHHSDWLPLDIQDNQAKSSIIEAPDWGKFPFVMPHEIVEAVRSVTDEERWIKLAEKCQSPNHYPCAVGISRLYFKLILWDKNQQAITKYVVLEIPMGC